MLNGTLLTGVMLIGIDIGIVSFMLGHSIIFSVLLSGVSGVLCTLSP